MEVPYPFVPLVLGCGDLKFRGTSGVGNEDKGKMMFSMVPGSSKFVTHTLYPDLIAGLDCTPVSLRFVIIFVVFSYFMYCDRTKKIWECFAQSFPLHNVVCGDYS